MASMRRSTLACLLLVACATTGDDAIFLESDSYGCGAVDGLGCGLAIAPVLERIDQLEGVEESSVSWDGRRFRIAVSRSADRDLIAAEAAALLEGDACCVMAPRGEAGQAPDRWFDASETVALSRHEASVIAADIAAEVEAEVPLDSETRSKLLHVLNEELELAFENAHAAGGGGERLWEQLPEAWPRFEARIAEFMAPQQADAVAAIVERRLGS
jgi:hypothetical protein